MRFRERVIRLFAHHRISDSLIAVRQPEGWVDLPRDEIAAVKAVTVSEVVVRLYDGRRVVLNLYHFGNRFEVVWRALSAASKENEKKRGLWDGATPLPFYDPKA